ncbi:DNA primase [Campylobacter sp.]|uniref:DNA primase n=1 Tax=Campylobacter sp. TaxID=205 RepID=UPI0026DB4183|nr:DNA primase [Campylobacter sp.]MDO4674435.1 DNA primase [Campylobacter sp.]
MLDMESIKSRIDIVRLVEHFLPLKKEGVFFKANCPFHSERTASFVVNPNKGLWHCFGCNKGGDAIKFVQAFKNLGFKEALEEIGRLEGIEINTGKPSSKAEFTFLNDLNEFFKSNMQENIRQYCYRRGLGDDDVSYFDVGYTGDVDRLVHFLRARGYLDLARRLGYIKEKDGKIYSIFARRLSFCIKDHLGRPRGFSARELINGTKLGKYVNSFKSDFFDKSSLLFNFDKAREYARIQKRLLLCEGFFDAIALHKSGFKNTAAICGTAFSIQHLSLIQRQNIEGLRLVFVPDKDAAGLDGAARALRLCFEQGFFDLEVALCKKKVKDVGEFLKKFPGESLKDHLHYYDGLEFYIKQRINAAADANAKFKIFKELSSIFNGLENFFLRDELFKKLSFYLDIDPAQAKKNENFNPPRRTPLTPPADRLVMQIIHAASNDDEYRERVMFYAGAYLGKFKAMLSGDGNLTSLECNPNFEPLAKDKQNAALRALVLRGLYMDLKAAQSCEQKVALSAKIYKLRNGEY